HRCRPSGLPEKLRDLSPGKRSGRREDRTGSGNRTQLVGRSHTRRYPGSQPIHIQWLRHLVGNPAEWRNSRRDHRQRDRISHYTAQRRRRRPHHLTRGYSITQSVKRLAYAAGIRGADYARRDGESVGLLERNYTLSPVKQADGRFTAPIQSSTLQLFNSSILQFFLIMLCFLLYTKYITSPIASQRP